MPREGRLRWLQPGAALRAFCLLLPPGPCSRECSACSLHWGSAGSCHGVRWGTGSLLFQICQKRFCVCNPSDCRSPSKPLGAPGEQCRVCLLNPTQPQDKCLPHTHLHTSACYSALHTPACTHTHPHTRTHPHTPTHPRTPLRTPAPHAPSSAAWPRCCGPNRLCVSLSHPPLWMQELGCLLSTSEGHHSQADAEIQRFSLPVTILMLHDLQSPARLFFWQQSICFRPIWVV